MKAGHVALKVQFLVFKRSAAGEMANGGLLRLREEGVISRLRERCYRNSIHRTGAV